MSGNTETRTALLQELPVSYNPLSSSNITLRETYSFHTAERTLEGVEALHMMRKGQVKRLDGTDAVGQAKFVESLFGVAA